MNVAETIKIMPPEPLRWSLDEYHTLAHSGAFGPEVRVELMDGVIIKHLPPDPLHSNAIDFARAALASAFTHVVCYLRSENPIVLPGDYQPQPDVVVVRGAPAQYRGRFPGAAEVLLLVEVAAASLDYDRRTKAPLYASAGISEYWIVNVDDWQLEVFRAPVNGAYTDTFTVAEAGSIVPLAALGSSVLVAALLP